MTQEEIEIHSELKEKFNNYPTLPKAVYIVETLKTVGHRESVIRGFKKRVKMWQNDHQSSLIEKLN